MGQWKTKPSKGGDGEYEKAPAGNHPAVLVAMIDMGTQEQEFKGEIKELHRAFFCWELVGEKTKGGKNHLIGMDLTVSLNERAKLRGWIEARIGRPLGEEEEYDFLQELGKPCLLNVVMNKSGYPKVDGMSAVPKGMTVPSPTFTVTSWHLDDYEATGKIDIPSWLPYLYGESVTDHIRRCGELTGKVDPPKPQSSPPPSSQSADASPPPPSAQSAPPSVRKFWLDCGGGKTEAFTDSNAAEFLTTKGVNVDTAMVNLAGTNEWKPAASYGLKTAF